MTRIATVIKTLSLSVTKIEERHLKLETLLVTHGDILAQLLSTMATIQHTIEGNPPGTSPYYPSSQQTKQSSGNNPLTTSNQKNQATSAITLPQIMSPPPNPGPDLSEDRTAL